MDPKKKKYASESAIVFRAVERRAAPGTESEIRLVRERNYSFPPEVAAEFDLEVSPSQAELYGFGAVEENRFEASFPMLDSPMLDSPMLDSLSFDDMPELIFDAPSYHAGSDLLERPKIAPAPPQIAKNMAKLTRSFHSIRTIHSLESSGQLNALQDVPKQDCSDSSHSSHSSHCLDWNKNQMEYLAEGFAGTEIRAFERKQTPTGLTFPTRQSSISRVDHKKDLKLYVALVAGAAFWGVLGLLGWSLL